MSCFSFGHRLPHLLSAPLFGDREKFGCIIQKDDPDWPAWQLFYKDFYQRTQKQGIGKIVNDAGNNILKEVDFEGKSILEIGPGVLPHSRFWNGKPRLYTIVDNMQSMLDESGRKIAEMNIPFQSFLLNTQELPIPDHQIDIVVSFFAFEYLQELDLTLSEIKRVLKPGGVLVGGIPTEGGLAWGLGRFLTSRGYIKNNSSINPDKIICWEHPNFAEDVLKMLDANFHPLQKELWFLFIQFIDLNWIVSYIFRFQMGPR